MILYTEKFYIRQSFLTLMKAAAPTLYFTSSLTATALCLYNVSIAGLAGSPCDSIFFFFFFFFFFLLKNYN